MTTVATLGGVIETIAANLTTTDATDLFTVKQGFIATLESLLISCATSTTIKIWITDGTTEWFLRNTETMAANTHDQIKDHPVLLLPNWKIRAQAGAANQISITGAVIRATSTTERPAALSAR
jgi:hypothetical protein